MIVFGGSQPARPINHRCGHNHLWLFSVLYRGNEAVTVSGNSFQVSGSVDGVAQGITQLLYCDVETLLDVYERAVGPETQVQVFSAHCFAGLFQKHSKDLSGLWLETHSIPVLAQLTCVFVKAVRPKPSNVGVGHGLFWSKWRAGYHRVQQRTTHRCVKCR